MSNQPQASVRKSTTWPLPAGSLSAVETPHYHSSGAHNSRSGPRNLCLCVPMTPCVISTHHPALHPREGTSTQTTDSRPLDRLVLLLTFVSVSVEAFFSIQTTVRTYLVPTMIPFGELEASNWDASAEQKWVRVMTIEVFFLGRKCWLWVLCMNVLWETSKEHHSQFGIFQECSSPQKGNPWKSMLALIKALHKLGKLI